MIFLYKIKNIKQPRKIYYKKMIYRNLGNSGLKVSVISLGNMINYKPENQKVDEQLIKTCIQKGINFFDTAQLYEAGEAQIALGKYLKKANVDRQSIIISTKIWTSKDNDINSTSNTNRKHLKQAINKSLQRLQLQYVDIVFAHRFDTKTPLEQICRAFHEIIEEGKAFYWGTSDWSADIIFQAFAICEKLNLHNPIAAQIQYNMLQRQEVEVEFKKLIETYKFGVLGWSALAGGILTGKYLNGIPQNQLNRFTDTNYFSSQVMKKFYFDPYSNEKSQNSLQKLHQVAQKLGCKMNHLALAWAIKFSYLSTALIGARNSEQLIDNLKSIEIIQKLTPQIQEEIEFILNTRPKSQMNFYLGKPAQPLR